MIPLWIGETGQSTAPGGYWPPLNVWVKFSLRGSDHVLEGFVTSVNVQHPDESWDKIEPVFVVKTKQTQKVYMAYEVQCWEMTPEEERRYQARHGLVLTESGEVLPRKEIGEVKFTPT